MTSSQPGCQEAPPVAWFTLNYHMISSTGNLKIRLSIPVAARRLPLRLQEVRGSSPAGE
ncbi:unnamed protein product [Nesidiocoris tenuis]|uniref:Uncharacterized protein n=1 Tax=Nesidiocoris tenuis TaxID=355587 RepID=A0A6H5G2A5_9HEMI|nr:unnamed protein product [Nesidiocoris tenuis]